MPDKEIVDRLGYEDGDQYEAQAVFFEQPPCFFTVYYPFLLPGTQKIVDVVRSSRFAIRFLSVYQ